MSQFLTLLQDINLGVRFLLELCFLVALGYWGFKTGRALVTKIGLGIGAPLLAAVVWALFVGPGASVPVPLRLILELIIFGLSVAALYVTRHPALAWTLGIVFAVNRVLMYVWDQ
jgi:Protein of unknown function (DUF2568)